ncbi:MAG: hypothetical protein ACXVXI_04745 [Mycobacteriaceae bacterium]
MSPARHPLYGILAAAAVARTGRTTGTFSRASDCLALQALGFRTLDLVLRGGMTAALSDRNGFHPAAIVAAATVLVVSLIVIASIP